MVRYKVTLAYDGAGYYGFQKQRDTRTPTIQGCIENALKLLGWNAKSILAAGRTDTGVHALGQVVAFDLEWRHSDSELLTAMNAHLPHDISILSVEQVNQNFHPRFDALSRRYVYRSYCQRTRNPLRDRYAWRIWPEVQIDSLQHAVEAIKGRHDFAAFGTPPGSRGTTTRNVMDANWQCSTDEVGQEWLIFDITADAFLFHMVRRIVSYFVAIGQGKHEEDEIQMLLEKPPAFPVQGLAPPQGLALIEVTYPS